MNNIYWHHGIIDRENRQKLKKHKSVCLWFTGLSGSGKSSIASCVEEKLFASGIHTYFLDGDNIRQGLNNDLGFSANDRKENIRRIGEVAKLFVDAGTVVLASFISPYQVDRDLVRQLFQKEDFLEVYVKCSIEVCEKRDPKGLYKKVRSGEITNFTGISAPYEEPEYPEIILSTDAFSLNENVKMVMTYLDNKILKSK